MFGSLDDSEGENFEITYEKSDYYEYVPVSGVRGGYQPRNDLKFEFVQDHYPAPTREKYALDGEGALGEIIERDEHEDLMRTIQFGMSTSPRTAVSIATFMISAVLDVPQEEVQDLLAEEYETEEGE